MLLDTCALLWLVSGGGQLTKKVLAQIEAAPVVYISAISGFEISLKYQQGKLILPVPPIEWFRIAIEYHDLTMLVLDLELCIAASLLPPIHKDPCDRFIIAAAQRYQTPVVTADPRFQAYGVQVIF